MPQNRGVVTLGVLLPDKTVSRLMELLAFVRSQLGEDASDEALTENLNSNLPAGKKFAAETVRRWANGSQSIGRPNKAKLAQSLGVSLLELNAFLQGGMESSHFFAQLQDGRELDAHDESALVSQIFQAMRKLSPARIAEVVTKGGELITQKLGHLFPATSAPKASIAQLVQDNYGACTEMFEDVVAPHRVDAIAQGAKPTDEELELLSSALSIGLEDLRQMRKKEFRNGNANQGCNQHH